MNLIISNQFVCEGDREALFPDNELVHIIREGNTVLRDMLDVLVVLKCFPSKSQARKNWKGSVAFPTGWSEFRIGKHKAHKVHICIWNPTE